MRNYHEVHKVLCGLLQYSLQWLVLAMDEKTVKKVKNQKQS